VPQIIPLKAVPSQTLDVVLNGQSCTLNVYQKAYGLFIDVYANGELVIGGVICQNLNRIVRDLYLGFVGDLSFIDNQGSEDPSYSSLGLRFSLAYLFPSDLPPGYG
jgi:hypothetical protein